MGVKRYQQRVKKGLEPSSALDAQAMLYISEHQLQASFFDWVEIKKKTDWRYSWIFAVPNGGHRHIGVARKLKKEGVRKGVPDVLIPVRSWDDVGAAIEFKVKKRQPTPEQKEWLHHLAVQGWACRVCYTLEEAIEFVEGYFS